MRDEAMAQLLPLADTEPAGDLRRRCVLNFQRLQDAPFRFEAMIRASTAREAPGDWVGRGLLGLTLLSQVLRVQPDSVEEIIAGLPGALNSRGYLGEILPTGCVDENQVAGHNALLRGLAEYFLWKKDPRARAILGTTVQELMLPMAPLLPQYPDRKLEKLADGVPIGLTVRNEGAWVGLSTDVGVVFFTLDGLTQTHAITPSPELRGLIEAMIARYAQLEIRAMSAQTHSTLSTLRGILRWWSDVDSRPDYLALVRERYALYQAVAETEHFANYNWFDRPRWTEACAVVDSFLLALELWRVTREPAYLTAAHRVYFNALSYAQRPNGGFGCDHCVGADGRVELAPHPEIFEAPWCCSMRGAEGLAVAARALAATDQEARRVAPLFYFEGDATLRFADGTARVRCVSEYPSAGRVEWTVLESTLQEPVTWSCFVPPGVADEGMRLRQDGRDVGLVPDGAGFVGAAVSLKAGAHLELQFPLNVRAEAPAAASRTEGHRRFACGPLVLGLEASAAGTTGVLPSDLDFAAEGRARFRCRRTGVVLAPFNDVTYRSEAEARAHRTRLLFPVSQPTLAPQE